MYEYKCQEVKKVVDGDTLDIVLNLGFNVLHSVRIRMAGIDTPESRTRDLDEKARGKLAKAFLKDWLSQENEKKKIVVRTFKKTKGKFGRVIAEIWVDDVNVNEDMIKCYHAVPYSAQNKKEVAELHLQNRERLIEQGVFKP
jgi:micrococcal nuclease